MACTIKITVQDKTWEITSELLSPGSQILSEEFIQALNGEHTIVDSEGKFVTWQDIKNYIVQVSQNKLKKTKTINPKTLLTSKGLMGNCTIAFLKEKYADEEIDWEGIDDNIEILLLNTLPSKTYPKGHVYYNSVQEDGSEKIKELFIIRDNLYQVKQLTNYLRLTKIIDGLIFDKEDEDILKAIKSEYNKANRKNPVESIQELLKRYLLYESEFSKLTYGEGKYAKVYLENYLRDINNVVRRIQYEDEYVNAFNSYLKYIKTPTSNGKRVPIISTNDFFTTLSVFHKKELEKLIDTSKSEPKQKEQFNELLNKKFGDVKELLSGIFNDLNYDDNITVIEILLDQWLFSIEPNFSYKFKSVRNIYKIPSIELESIPRNISDYGITYENISEFSILDKEIKGYKIYTRVNPKTQQVEYIPTKHYLTEKTFTKPFNTEEEAITWIEKQFEKEVVGKSALFPLKFRRFASGKPVSDEVDDLDVYLRMKLPEGTIINSIDIALNPEIQFNIEAEKFLVEDKHASFNDFIKYIGEMILITDDPIKKPEQELRDYILEKINTPEKAGIFIWKLNQDIVDGQRTYDKVKAIVDEIDNASVKQYYIHKQAPVSSTRDLYGFGFKTRIIPTTTNDVNINAESISYKQNKRTPILTTLYAVQKVFTEKYNVKINLINSDEIKSNEIYKGIDPNGVKAFILNGEIYVNTDSASPEDILHEYTHLLLGVLKSNRNTRSHYLELLGMILKTKQGQSKLEELRQSRSDIFSEIDLAEEVFADLFGDYVARNLINLDSDVVSIFVDDEKYRLKKSKNKKSLSQEITSIFKLSANESLSSIYGKSFESIIEKFSTDVHDLLKNDDRPTFSSTVESRKVSNWIENQIKLNNIEEYDCV